MARIPATRPSRLFRNASHYWWGSNAAIGNRVLRERSSSRRTDKELYQLGGAFKDWGSHYQQICIPTPQSNPCTSPVGQVFGHRPT